MFFYYVIMFLLCFIALVSCFFFNLVKINPTAVWLRLSVFANELFIYTYIYNENVATFIVFLILNNILKNITFGSA